MRDATARSECEALARASPHGLTFRGLETHTYCKRLHRVARFSRDEGGKPVHFVLLPGGEVSLGYDGRSFRPTPHQIESFAESAEAPEFHAPIDAVLTAFDLPPSVAEDLLEEYDLGRNYLRTDSIEEFVDAHTSAPRTTSIAPILIETEGQEIQKREDMEPIDEDDPVFDRFRLRDPEGWKIAEIHCGDCRYIVERNDVGPIRVWRQPPITYDRVRARLAPTGMRLPTCDEWEFACGGGAPTLFRWGDHCPADYYPTDTCAEDRDLKIAWALSRGELAYEAPPADWDLHQQRNLFGLRIADNPYHPDLVSEGPLALGGDGGENICGGVGFFLGWFPLATAFRIPGMGFRQDEDISSHFRVRRVIPID